MFLLLEEGSESTLGALVTAVREPWLARGLLLHHARTGSRRALMLLAAAPEHHARPALDTLADLLRAPEPAPRRAAAAAAALLAARRPNWLLAPAPAPAPTVLRLLARERDPTACLHALLALAALVPASPSLAGDAALWPELAELVCRLAAATRDPHRDVALHALFRALYATRPLALLEHLRTECARDRSEPLRRGLGPLFDAVRLHTALVTDSRRAEAAPGRWARSERHDVLAECRRLSADRPRVRPPTPDSPPPAPTAAPPAPRDAPEESGARASLDASKLLPGEDGWFCLSERCEEDAGPPTPLPAPDTDESPPEAAVEATPENTPVKEMRAQFLFPTDSTCVRAIGRPSPPLDQEGGRGDAYSSRLARVVLERTGSPLRPGGPARGPPDSPVTLGAAPPPAEWPIARPEPSRPARVLLGPDRDPPPDAPDREDREVLELTGGGRVCSSSVDLDTSGPRLLSSRLRRLRDLAPAPGVAAGVEGPTSRRPSRARSCPALREPAPRVRSAASQTIDAGPPVDAAALADYFRPSPAPEEPRPSARLDDYLRRLYEGGAWSAGGATNGAGRERDLAEQLALTHAQLQYERWRREAHAERCRRLLGRCRRARALEMEHGALRDRLQAATRACDDLRGRLARARPDDSRPHLDTDDDRAVVLEAALLAEREAHARTAARLHDTEVRLADEAAEARGLREAAFELRRRADVGERAVTAAERRADAVGSLRRELVLRGEREGRLAGALREAAAREAGRADERRALRQARGEAAAARAEGAAAGARSEAAAARETELEAALQARDAALEGARREARETAAAHAAELAAVQDKYRALLHVLRRVELRRLEPPTPAPSCPQRPPPPPPDLDTALRTRRLLDEDDEEEEPVTSAVHRPH